MTIERGAPWGQPGALAADGVLARSDRDVSAVIADARRRSVDVPPIGLLAGDLARTCGATGSSERLRSEAAHLLPVDVGEALVDGVYRPFVAHLVVRRRLWAGTSIVIMNAQYLGAWDVAPGGHPNDGRLDAFVASMSLSDRLEARRRLPTGSHLPHPGIERRRITAEQYDVPRGAKVWVDGECIGAARHISVRCVPDALTVVV